MGMLLAHDDSYVLARASCKTRTGLMCAHFIVGRITSHLPCDTSSSLPALPPSPALTRRRVHNDFLCGRVNNRQGQGRLDELASNVELELERLEVDEAGIRHGFLVVGFGRGNSAAVD